MAKVLFAFHICCQEKLLNNNTYVQIGIAVLVEKLILRYEFTLVMP